MFFIKSGCGFLVWFCLIEDPQDVGIELSDELSAGSADETQPLAVSYRVLKINLMTSFLNAPTIFYFAFSGTAIKPTSSEVQRRRGLGTSFVDRY